MPTGAPPLSWDLEKTHEHMSELAGSAARVSYSLKTLVDDFHKSSGALNELVRKHRDAIEVSRRIHDEWQKSHRINIQSINEYAKLTEGVRKLTAQYKEFERVQKMLEFSSKGMYEKIRLTTDAMGRMANSAVGLAGKFGGLALGYRELTERLITYNRTVFDGMRIGLRYGDSMSGFERALKDVNRTTAFSKQSFAELNATIKQTMVGMPMTAAAVSKLAEAFSGKFGWSAERVTAAIKELLPLQSRMPSLFDRLNKVVYEFDHGVAGAAKSADDLYNKLIAIGASQNEIETALSFMTKAPDLDAWMGFEKTIATAKRDIEDANLKIAQNMKGGLESVAKVQAGIASSIAALPKSIMYAVGAAALLAAELAVVMQNAMAAAGWMKTMGGMRGGLGGTGGAVAVGGAMTFNPRTGAMEPESWRGGGPGTAAAGGGRFAAGLRGAGAFARSPGGVALIGGTAAYGVSKLTDNRMITGAASGAALGATIGSIIPGVGTVVGGLAGGVIGGGIGAYQQWAAGNEAAAEQNRSRAEAEKMGGARMSLTARAHGVNVSSEASRNEVIEALRIETDESKRQLALQDLYSQNLIKRKEIQDLLLRSGMNQETVDKKIDDIVVKTWTNEKGRFETNMQIKRAVEGQLKELQLILDVAKRVRESGEGIPDALKEGRMGSGMAKALGGAAIQAAKTEADVAGRMFSLAFIRAHADDPEIQKLLTNPQQKALAQNKIDRERNAREVAKIMEDMDKQIAATSDEEQKASIRETSMAQKAALEKAAKDADDLMSKSTGLDKVLSPEKATRLFQEESRNAKSMVGDLEKRAAIQNKIVQYEGHAREFQEAGARARMIEVQVGTAQAQREVDLLEQQISLGESRLALAEKMGMPQSYRALSDQVNLVYQSYQATKEWKEEQDKIIEGWRMAGLDTVSILNGTKTVKQALQDIGNDRDEDEQKIVQAMRLQFDLSKKLTDQTGRLAELTKTWREGWMDAMEESVANAGDFAAIIGMGNKNVPETIAVGAPDTFRRGGINRQRLDDYTMQQLRYGQAARFTNQFGEVNGNIQNPNPLMIHSGAMLLNPQGIEGLQKANQDAVRNNAIPVSPTGPASQASMDAMEEAVARGVSRGINYRPTGGPSLGTDEYLKASVRGLGTGQPGNIPAGKVVPDVVNPLGGLADSANKAAAALEHIGSLYNVKTDVPTKGGVVRRAGGGSVGSSANSGRKAVDINGQKFMMTADEYDMAIRRQFARDNIKRQKYGMDATANVGGLSPEMTRLMVNVAEAKKAKEDIWSDYNNPSGKSSKSEANYLNAIGTKNKAVQAAYDEAVRRASILPNYEQRVINESKAWHARVDAPIGSQTPRGPVGTGPRAVGRITLPNGDILMVSADGKDAFRYGPSTGLSPKSSSTNDAQYNAYEMAIRRQFARDNIKRQKYGLDATANVGGLNPEMTRLMVKVAEARRAKEDIWSDFNNPTGKASKSEQEYMDAIDAQNKAIKKSYDAKLAREMAQEAAYQNAIQQSKDFYDRTNAPISAAERDAALAAGNPFGGLGRGGGRTLENRGPSGRLENRGPSGRLEDRGPSGRLENRGPSGRLENRGPSGRLEGRGFADGGMIEPGSFIVKQSAASANAGVLNSIGADWITGGTPGRDSVAFDVMAGGGRVLAMPGEAIVPPEFAGVGQAINDGLLRLEKGGSVGGGGSGSSGGAVTLELTPEVAELLRFQGKSDYRNGSSI